MQKKAKKTPMTGMEIKVELDKLGLDMTKLALRIEGVSYNTIYRTVKGIFHNRRVLEYLDGLGIKHGRTPSKRGEGKRLPA